MKDRQKFCTPYDILGGILSGLLIVVISTAFTALVFKGSLIAYFSIGISCALVGAGITNLLTASYSSFSSAIARIEPASGAILAIIFANIAAMTTLPSTAIFPTLLATLTVSSLITGVALFLLGYLRLGHIVRFLPYPVLGGLISGTSWIMGYTTFAMIANNNFSLQNLLQHEIILQLCLGFGFALFLLVMTKINKRTWILPVSLLVFSVVINLFLSLNHVTHVDAVQRGWLFSSFKPTLVLQSVNVSMFYQIDWAAIFSQLAYLFSFSGVIIIILLFNVSSLETTLKEKADLDHELKIAGIGNLVGGVFSGATANLSLSGTLVNQSMGAASRVSGVIASVVCAAVLFLYPALVSFLPKPVIGGLLIFIASRLLIEWLYTDRHKLPIIDYFIVVAILITIAIYGFMPGVIVGIIITCIVFIVRYAQIDAVKFTTTRQNYPSNVIRPAYEQDWLNTHGKAIQLFKLQDYLFFGSAKFLLDKITRLLDVDKKRELKFLIFDFQLVNGIDSSASFSFIRLQQIIAKLNLKIIFTHCSDSLIAQFKSQDVITDTDENIILADLDQGMEWCEEQLLKNMPAELKPKELSIVDTLSQLTLDKAQQVIFTTYLEKMAVPKNAYICMEGELLDGLYFIESGEVSVLLENENSVMRLSKSGPGTIVGEISFYLRTPRSASVRTELPCVIYKLTADALVKLESDYPEIAVRFHKSIVRVLALRVVQTNYELKLIAQ